jgi:hypothetical protein
MEMKHEGVRQLPESAYPDKRAANMSIPLHLLMALSIAAKMKIMTSLTDIPFAITDAETLLKIGWNLWDSERDLEYGLMSEGTIRNWVGKYNSYVLNKSTSSETFTSSGRDCSIICGIASLAIVFTPVMFCFQPTPLDKHGGFPFLNSHSLGWCGSSI